MSETQSNNTMKIIAAIVISIVVVGGGIFALGKLLQPEDQGFEYQGAVITKKMNDRDLSITDINDTVHSLSDQTGKVIVMYYFWINCQYCPANAEALNTTFTKFTTDELIIYAISVDRTNDNNENLQEWRDEGDYPFVVALDTASYDYRTEFDLGNSVPTTVYIAPNGEYKVVVGAQNAQTHENTINIFLAKTE